MPRLAKSPAAAPKGAESSSLNARELRFCARYVVHLNATLAAKEAGYADKSSKQRGHELLQRPAIQAEIERLVHETTAAAQASAEDVLRELAVILRSDVRHFTVNASGELALADGAPESAWRAVSGVKYHHSKHGRSVEFRLWSKTDATRQLGEYHKLFIKRHEVELPAGGGVLAVPLPLDAAQWGTLAAAQQTELLKHPAAAAPGAP
jgi:phage terminase small subunit